MIIKKCLWWMMLGGSILLAGACAENSAKHQGPYAAHPTSSDPLTRPSRAEIESRILQELEDLGETRLAASERSYQLRNHGTVTSDIPIVLNERVEFFINYYQTKMPARFTRYLNRSGRYYTMMRDILKEYGLPQDLFYLALIESGFTTSATSHAGASGPWQFMPATARRFGLRVDAWVDERRDPVKSTHAAAQYLKFLYGEFDSWYLAAAGYNAGENKIKRALTMYQVNDFWNISQSDQSYLAEETKQYVPRMIAAAIIAKEPAKYGFEVQYEKPLAYEEMLIHPTTSLAAIAKAAGKSDSDLLELNPELKRAASPPGDMYSLKVPQGSLAAMTQAYASLTPEQRMANLSPSAPPSAAGRSYRVARGDTLSRIAQRNKCSLAQLYAANPGLRSNSRLKIGQTIRLPGAAPVLARNAGGDNSRLATAPVTYKVRGGDTLTNIAQRNNCSVAQIYALNPNLNNKPDIRQGQNLKVPGNVAQAQLDIARSNQESRARENRQAASSPAPPVNSQPAVYKVRSGDTLGGIAQRSNCSTAQLYALNPGLNNKPNIRVGQNINLPGRGTPASVQAGAASSAPLLSSGNTRTITHQVQRGDTIYSLARAYNLSAQEISAQLGRQTLYAGEKLRFKVPASHAEAHRASPAGQDLTKYYVVRQGDTLWGVSSRFKVSVSDIKRMNNLDSDKLSVGLKLQIR